MENKTNLQNLDEKVSLLEEKVEKIRLIDKYEVIQRNWRTSKTRIIYLAVSTYVLSLIVLILAGLENPFFAALVPAAGVLISFPSFPLIKRLWLKYYLHSVDTKKKTNVVDLQQEKEQDEKAATGQLESQDSFSQPKP